MASFWTDLLASLANANTGGRFDIAKAVYGVTPEGRQRRAAQVGLEGAETGAGVADATTKQRLAQQVQAYLAQNADAGGLPFEAQREAVRSARVGTDINAFDFGQHQTDVAGARKRGMPGSRFGLDSAIAEENMLNQDVQVELERERTRELARQFNVRTAGDLMQTPPIQTTYDAKGNPIQQPVDTSDIYNQILKSSGFGRVGQVSNERSRAAALHSGRGTPQKALPPPAPNTPSSSIFPLQQHILPDFKTPGLKNMIIGGAKATTSIANQIANLPETVKRNLVVRPAKEFARIIAEMFGGAEPTPEQVRELKQQIAQEQGRR